jgi:hypothetical protein
MHYGWAHCDVDAAWDEGRLQMSCSVWDMQATKPTFRLHIYVQLGTRRSSTGQASSIVSEVRPAAVLTVSCRHLGS